MNADAVVMLITLVSAVRASPLRSRPNNLDPIIEPNLSASSFFQARAALTGINRSIYSEIPEIQKLGRDAVSAFLDFAVLNTFLRSNHKDQEGLYTPVGY